MHSKIAGLSMAIALLSVLIFSSAVSGQDLFAQIHSSPDLFNLSDSQSSRARVSSVPSDVLGIEKQEVYEESSNDHRSDFFVFIGFSGLFLAGVSAASICMILRKRSRNQGPPRLVGVQRVAA